MSTVSGAKQLILDDDKLLREQTKALKEDTKPPSGYINARVVTKYNTIVWKKGQRGVKYVNEQEAIMANAIRYNITKLSKG